MSAGKGAQRNESTPFPMIAHSLPYREGFDAYFPLHCTTRQTSLSSVLVLYKTDHFHSPIQNDFQVFGARYFEGVVLCGEEAIHEFTMLGMLYFLPEYCQTSHSLLYGTAVLHAVLIAAANTCHVYSHKEPQNQGVSQLYSYLTCTLHAHELVQMSSVNEATAF